MDANPAVSASAPWIPVADECGCAGEGVGFEEIDLRKERFKVPVPTAGIDTGADADASVEVAVAAD
jgi:hypothetical protein